MLLIHTITIRKPISRPDGAGGHSQDWIDIQTVKARVTVARSNPFVTAGQQRVNYSHIIFMGKTVDCVAGDRLKHGDLKYNVISSDVPSGSKYLEVKADVVTGER